MQNPHSLLYTQKKKSAPFIHLLNLDESNELFEVIRGTPQDLTASLISKAVPNTWTNVQVKEALRQFNRTNLWAAIKSTVGFTGKFLLKNFLPETFQQQLRAAESSNKSHCGRIQLNSTELSSPGFKPNA